MSRSVRKGTWQSLGPWRLLDTWWSLGKNVSHGVKEGTWRPLHTWRPSGQNVSRGVREGTWQPLDTWRPLGQSVLRGVREGTWWPLCTWWLLDMWQPLGLNMSRSVREGTWQPLCTWWPVGDRKSFWWSKIFLVNSWCFWWPTTLGFFSGWWKYSLSISPNSMVVMQVDKCGMRTVML